MTTFPNAPWSIDPDEEWFILDKDGDKIADVSAALYKQGENFIDEPYARSVRRAIIEASKGGQS